MEQVPQNLPDNVREYFARHLGRLELALQNTDQLQRYTSLPAKPSIGKIYYFSNAVLPTITAEGAWLYKSTGWQQL